MRYRHVWPGLLLLTALAGLLVSLLAWGEHFLSPGPSGGIRRMLQLWAASRPIEEAPRPAPLPATAAATPASENPAAPEPLAPVSDRPVQESPGRATPQTEPAPSPSADPPSKRQPASPPQPGSLPQPRYALDLGAFALEAEAERVEAQLNQAGFSTVRFRQQAPARLFSVLILLREAGEGQAVVELLKQEGLAQARAVTAESGPSVRAAHAMPLRTAVQLGDRLRSAGYEVRVTAEATRPGQITLRHGNFTSRQEAEAVSREISRLGVPNEIVEIR